MADEILSIEESTLNAIAHAIKNKGGTSAKLSFPDGMVAALRNIETVATVTPKVSPPSTKELTPSDTSFAIEQGYHTKSTIVSISTATGSATPSSTEQTYYPQSPYNFFSSFWVDGIGAGYKVVTGTITIGKDRNCTISGLSFTPAGAMVVRTSDTGSTSGDRLVAFETPIPASGTSLFYGTVAYSKRFMSGPSVSAEITYSYGSVNLYTYSASYQFNGTYSYVVWGS